MRVRRRKTSSDSRYVESYIPTEKGRKILDALRVVVFHFIHATQMMLQISKQSVLSRKGATAEYDRYRRHPESCHQRHHHQLGLRRRTRDSGMVSVSRMRTLSRRTQWGNAKMRMARGRSLCKGRSCRRCVGRRNAPAVTSSCASVVPLTPEEERLYSLQSTPRQGT